MKVPVIALLLLAQASPALADKAYEACTDRTDTSPGFMACGTAYLDRADRALNAAWKRAFALAKGQTRSDLLAEQRAWIAYKDASCRFYANGDWGREGEVLHYFGCRGQVIERRTADLDGVARFIGQ